MDPEGSGFRIKDLGLQVGFGLGLRVPLELSALDGKLLKPKPLNRRPYKL